MTKIVIYCLDRIKGNRKIEEVANKWQSIDCHMKLIKSYAGYRLIIPSLEQEWRVVTASDNARGIKWDWAWIDENISIQTLHELIYPSGRHHDDYKERVSYF